MADFQPAPLQDVKQLPPSYQLWFNAIRKLINDNVVGSISWSRIDTSGSSLSDITTRTHNLLTAMDGGTTGQYFHLTDSQHKNLTALTTLTTNTTLDTSHGYVLVNSTSGTITITLPAATTRKRYHIKKIDSSVNSVDITRAGSDTIEGSTSVSLTAQYDSVTIYSDGTSVWYIEGTT